MTRRRACAPVLAALALLLAACGDVHRGDEDDDSGAESDDDGGGDSGDGAGDDGGEGDGGSGGAELCVGASGERIRRVVRQHDDGTGEAIALHDTELGATCQFGFDGQGNVRCMPDVNGAPFASAGRVFTDAGCTSAVADFSFLPRGTPTYAVIAETGAGCSSLRRWYELGAQVPLDDTSTIYYRATSGICTASTASTSHYYAALAAEMALDRFVIGTESRHSSGRLSVQIVEGEDGSRFCDRRIGFRDADLGGHACTPDRGEDSVLRCVPDSASTMQVSTDSGCGGEFTVATVSTACDLGQEYTRETVTPGCLARWRVHELGAPVAGALYSYVPFDGCYPAPTDHQYYEIGPVVAPTSFAELTLESVDVGGRLHRVNLVGDGLRVDRPFWYDSARDVTCQFQLAADGISRCLPGRSDEPEAGITTFYTDPACKGGTVELASFADPCESGREPRFVVGNRGGGTRVFELGRAAEGPIYQWSGSCTTVPATTRVHTVGEELPLDSFVSGSEQVEP